LVLLDTSYPNPMGCLTFCYQKSINGCYLIIAGAIVVYKYCCVSEMAVRLGR
jgi:hypothetical protein